MSESPQLRRQARWVIEAAIERNAVEAFGARVIERPSMRGPTYPSIRDVSALPGMRAAWHAQAVAAARARCYAITARGQGVSWEEIGESLDLLALVAERGRSVGEAAFEFVAGVRRVGWSPYTRWRCSSCGDWVTDHGPYDGSPEHTEVGHASRCERHSREITHHHATVWDER